jgi:purine-nucleoside phosphorylase
MAGRCHLYEGYSLDDLMLPVRVLHALGIELLIITNAAGGLNPLFQVGDVMILSDHIDLMFPRTRRAGLAVTAEGTSGDSRRERPQSFYDTALVEQTVAIARQGNFPLQHGVYVGVKGPNYETRAEYRAFRKLGGDVVGMSTIPEVLAAHALGVRVLGLSTVTNIARPDAPQTITPAEVVAMAGRAEPKVRRIVAEVVRGLA